MWARVFANDPLDLPFPMAVPLVAWPLLLRVSLLSRTLHLLLPGPSPVLLSHQMAVAGPPSAKA